MTFNNAPSAIDGALLSGALIRRAQYADQPRQGVVKAGDLKVTPLDTPGVGVQIAPGVGLVLNNYQTVVNETYVVSNPGVHIIPSVEMPASNASPKSYIVAVIVGDPDFTQTGHPFMLVTDPPEGEEQTFEYVRVRLIEVSAGATELSGAYPALPLARIDIPAITTTITGDMIHDLTTLARPRQSQDIRVSPSGTWTNASPVRIPSGSTYGNWTWSSYQPSVSVPEWATRAIMVAHVNGVRLSDTSANVSGAVRPQLGSVVGPVTSFDYSTGGGAIRDNLMCGGEFDVTSLQGTDADLLVEGYENVPGSPTLAQRLTLQGGSQVIFDIRFFEE